jgi:hypothetical protein
MPVKYADLRAGHVPLPGPAPGYDPAGDAGHLIRAGTPSPAARPVPGWQLLGALVGGQRFVLRIPQEWNGDLVACGTPATRSEFANDAVFGDYLLARGFAFASGDKGIPYNGVLERAASTPDPGIAYPVPFEFEALRQHEMVIRPGALWPQRTSVRGWHESFAELVRFAKERTADIAGRPPRRTYAVGLSIGGGQVRWLLEREPELVDGGLEWAAVLWTPEENILTYLPAFLGSMPAYVGSGFSDRAARDAIVAAGFPPDRIQDDPVHRSLWDDHYSNLPPFYADLTVFAFGMLLDPEARSWCGPRPNVPNPVTGARGSGEVEATGLALPEVRASYVPSPGARSAIAEFAQSGRIERPLVGLAGDADVFITPQHNFAPYLRSVRAAGRADRYWQYLVEGGPHVDAYTNFGYGLQAQLPFVWRAFEQLVRIVDDGDRPAGAGTTRTIRTPDEIA